MANRSYVEYFLHGDKLKGRYTFQRADFGEHRAWIFEKPNSEVPYAQENDLQATLKRLKERGHHFLIWGMPGGKSVLYDVKTGQPVELKN